ncbi:G0/G1 switch protein 2 [Oryzias latipes]|uniref:G0/G1 switch protein 2 n=1 Tax=Oryzias latipes TaxID=8090 RepID=UPI0000E9D021|nr:G0/G1 switch protein 2 [Oryzias latipes]
MDSMQELIPFAKEMLRQKPGRGLLKIYLLGSVLAVLGTAISLVQTVCRPFSSGDPVDPEMLLMLARVRNEAESGTKNSLEWFTEEEEEEVVLDENRFAKTQILHSSKSHTFSPRNQINRLHAS